MHSDDAGVIVVGGGHAGVEAAHAAAKMGVPTLLLTGDPSRICTLPCNPSIGGSAKGQLVREIDALGGAMGVLADACSLHARFLNESKGPAVRALRQLMDKPSYNRMALRLLQTLPALRIEAAMVEELIVSAGEVRGVRCADGRSFYARRVVLATGTFLGGKLFRGEEVQPGGRHAEAPAIGLSHALRALGFSMQRLKTGTPPRVDRSSVEYGAMRVQEPSATPLLFSRRSEARFAGEQLPCYLIDTNERTHALVRENLHRSPLYGLDLIRGIGPRYCPSIEDKVIKFAHNPTHQLFIEPEGWDEPTLYVGGFSTSLPADVQLAMLQTLPGMERCEMLRAGYAVEYDMVAPTELDDTLQTHRIAGLYHCGQLNGTSGYEEAAAQGLVAGANAALAARGRDPLRIARSEGYIGVLVDDLVGKGVDEPYRMLTSRAEHRVLLRHDNADRRLTPHGRDIGLVDDSQWMVFTEEIALLDRAVSDAERLRLPVREIGSERFQAPPTLAEALRRPQVRVAELRPWLPEELSADLAERIEIEVKIEGYVKREEQAIVQAARRERLVIPADFAYEGISALSSEAREKLARQRPRTLGAAGRIPGVAPTDVAILSLHLQRPEHGSAAVTR
ncbi:MAG: tRNA uridine-5-carboxymethylaminomethyl(34) synthesis enzyme MnmG [Candidatus Eremiobacteraeota bacterium]|nr:tRNA uridine-5-carboxymethylaminomethyl(34) synthesis enzyme MnmG [Candidatus Eremiobacteraeota bacterium]